MVLRDEHKYELWLSGCSGGYRGTGPMGAGYILLKEGFRMSNSPCPDLRSAHLAKGSAAPLVAERNPGGTDMAEDASFVDHLLDAEASGYFQSLQED